MTLLRIAKWMLEENIQGRDNYKYERMSWYFGFDTLIPKQLFMLQHYRAENGKWFF